KHGHGIVNLAKAITVSCDVFFYELASKMGIQRIDDILNQFGFGQLTGIDIGEELGGTVASPQWKKKTKGISWYPGDTVISGIGQGFMQVTPLQLASAVATIANRGQRYAPYLLMAEQQPNKEPSIQVPTPLNKIQLSDPNGWNLVINAMQNVVQSPEGTAYTRFGTDYSYSVAGKTGTAQLVKRIHYDNESDHDNQAYLPENL